MRLATELSLTRTATLRGLAACVLCNAVAWPQAALSLDQAILTDGSRWQPAGEPKQASSYFPQLLAGEKCLDSLLQNWMESTVLPTGALDGDAVRRVVGTVGVGSPLFGLEKVLRIVGDDLDKNGEQSFDWIQYTELSDELIQDLRDVDAMAYSAIFSDPSGNVGRSEQSSAAYLERARVASTRALRNYRRLLGLLPISAQ
jgi:hypothetical protein